MSGSRVNWKMSPTANINSTPTLVFGNDQHTCIVDGIILSNLTDAIILVSLSVAREIEIGVETTFVLAQQLPLQPFERIDALLNMTLTLEPGDLLYANSDYAGNSFNIFVNYRELTEL